MRRVVHANPNLNEPEGLSPRRADDRRLADLLERTYAFIYDLALRFAGYDPEFSMGKPEIRQQFRNYAQPLLDTGWSFRPDFGEVGQVVFYDTDPIEAVVLVEDRSSREADNGELVPNPLRLWRLSLRFNEKDVVIRARLEIARLVSGFDPSGPSPAGLAAFIEGTPPTSAEASESKAPVVLAPTEDCPRCAHEGGCEGAPLPTSQFCLAHVPDEQRQTYLDAPPTQLVVPGVEMPVIDARGVPISDALLRQVLAARRQSAPYPRLDLDRARFLDRVLLRGLVFRPHEITFDGACFERDADFQYCHFLGHAPFTGARFTAANFSKANFSGPALFERTTFDGQATFDGCQFAAGAGFQLASFRDRTRFTSVIFRTTQKSIFTELLFGAASFADARFEQSVSLGPLLSAGEISFDHTLFEQDAELNVSAQLVSCAGTHFRARADLALTHGELYLDGARFGATATVTSSPADPIKLISVRGADVAGLVLTDVDVRRCRFRGAVHLEDLNFHAETAFAEAPSPVWLRARRVVIEEAFYRLSQVEAREARDVGGASVIFTRHGMPQQAWWRRWWNRIWANWPAVLDADQLVEAARREPDVTVGELAAVYRGLRLGRDKMRDVPGASDFSYGEMEMRRARSKSEGNSPATTPQRPHRMRSISTERLLLDSFWLTSGYLLRPVRVLMWFAVVVAVGTLVLGLAGFHGHESVGTAVGVSFGSALPPPSSPARLGLAAHYSQTSAGHAVTDTLQIVGPILLALALASVRGWLRR